MALQTKTISNILKVARYTLQDSSGTRWTDEEMFAYVDMGLRDIALRTLYNRKSEEITVSASSTSYTLDHEVIKIHSIDSAQTFTLTDATTLTVVDPSAEDITVDYYAYPPRVTHGTTTTLTLEQDMFDLLVWYVLSKCYEKEDSTELLEKSGYFLKRYMDFMELNMTRWHGELEPVLAKRDFY